MAYLRACFGGYCYKSQSGSFLQQTFSSTEAGDEVPVLKSRWVTTCNVRIDGHFATWVNDCLRSEWPPHLFVRIAWHLWWEGLCSIGSWNGCIQENILFSLCYFVSSVLRRHALFPGTHGQGFERLRQDCASAVPQVMACYCQDVFWRS
jgi:hypothetical protein